MTQPPIDPGQQPNNPGQPGYPPAGQQPGAYPPAAGQQPGAYPPPPPGAPGSYPPPPPGGAYPQGPAAGQPYNIGDGFSWAFNKFGKNAGPLIIATLIYLIIVGVVYGIFYGIGFALADKETVYGTTTVSFGAGTFAVWIIGYLVTLVVGGYVLSSFWNGILQITDGQQVSVGSFFQPRNVGNVIIATLLSGIIIGIGYALCVLPGLIAAIFLFFTVVAVVDRNISGTAGLGASFNLVKENFGPAILTWLVVSIALAIGGAICAIGLLVAGPVAGLLTAYAWRKLTGGFVAPATQ
ncbi:hypothetical protein [Gordonia crocea]|uniref:Integral membrane protein n=1 Tax=Gordonia crocea TaxID=589162 RepID=A0A7I9UUV3_9ACTN|nr:hypothetical protein [Gordonia crocea]GED96984.1 hypothetical protein nbrc107697_10230 [Gordonia crocea]